MSAGAHDHGGSAAPLYIADTNVYIMAANDPAFRARFEAFIHECGPVVVSAVVVAELLIGISDSRRHRAALQALSRGGDLLAPNRSDWIVAGATVSKLGGRSVTARRSFWNDALLAAQCARLGATLVTSNTADFRRLGRRLALRVVAPFP